MTLVSTVTVGSGGAASIEFTNIPQTGKDLLVLFSGRGDSTAFAFVGVNGDTSNYQRIQIRNDNGNVSSSTFTGFRGLAVSNDSSYTANTFGNSSIYFSNYASSASKPYSIDGTGENNGTNIQQTLQAVSYTQTTAITSVQLAATSGNLVQHSSASLYIIS